MTAHIITGPVSFLCLAVVVVWIAKRRTGKRRAEVERAAATRRAEAESLREAAYRAVARVNLGMPVRHPETPGLPTEAEAAALAELLDGIDITNPGGTQ